MHGCQSVNLAFFMSVIKSMWIGSESWLILEQVMKTLKSNITQAADKCIVDY